MLYVLVVNAPFFGLHLFFPLSFPLHVVYYIHDCSCSSLVGRQRKEVKVGFIPVPHYSVN